MATPTLNWPLPRAVAHRCGGALAPENSLAGLRVAAALGFRAVEFDVMLSADGTPWVIHDETLERTTTGSGRVCETSDEVLRRIDIGSPLHKAFAGEPMATFEAKTLRCHELGLQANVEIKPAEGHEVETGDVVARRILSLWEGRPLPLVSSFSFAALQAARKVAPSLPLGFLYSKAPADWLQRFDDLAGYSLHCAKDVDDAVLAQAKARKIPVLCYTVNDPRQAQSLFDRGVTAVFSDRLDLMADYR